MSQCFSLCSVHNNSGGSRAEARGARSPLFLDCRAAKNFFETLLIFFSFIVQFRLRNISMWSIESIDYDRLKFGKRVNN